MYSLEIYSSLPISYPGVTIDSPSRASRYGAAESSGIERSRGGIAVVVVSRAIPIRDTARTIGFRSWKTRAPNGFPLSFTFVASSHEGRWTAKRTIEARTIQERFVFPRRREEHRGESNVGRARIARASRCHCQIMIGALSGRQPGNRRR